MNTSSISLKSLTFIAAALSMMATANAATRMPAPNELGCAGHHATVFNPSDGTQDSAPSANR